MSLSDLASLGSFVSGIAVVFSFVFLGLQIRQADKNQKAVLLNESVSRGHAHLMTLTEPHLADLYRRMIEGPADFTETELIQLLNLLTSMLNSAEELEFRRAMALADKDNLESSDNVIKWMFSLPIPRALWPMLRQNFSLKFRNHIGEIIRTTPISKPASLKSLFAANLARNQAAPDVQGAMR